MRNEINKRLQNFLDKHPEFKGEFIGYKQSRGGLGISRIDDHWYECEDYLISIDKLIKCLSKMDRIGFRAMDDKLKKKLKINGCGHLINPLENVKPSNARQMAEGMKFVFDNWDVSPSGGVLLDIIDYLKENTTP